MPRTKSAERRMRSSAKRRLRNQGTKSRVKTLEKNYLATLANKDKEKGAAGLRAMNSALDKAVKSGVLHANTAARKKSRLAVKLGALA